MDLLKNFKWTNLLKIAGVVLVLIVVALIAIRLIATTFSSIVSEDAKSSPSYAPAMGLGGSKNDLGYSESLSLSVRNTAPTSSPDSVTVPADAEDMEVTEYNAFIETRKLTDHCTVISDLKPRSDVIFESSSENKNSCYFRFKVKKDSVNEILAIIKELNPRDLNERTLSIKRLVDDFTSEIDILESKLANIEETLTSAVESYDDLTKLANRVQDVETLSKIITSKINIIERLTEEKISVSAKLEKISRAKAEQLDRLEHTYFDVRIYENKYIDVDSIRDSWKAEIQKFFRTINKIAQDITVNLSIYILRVLQYALYVLILLFVAKYGYKLVRYIWNR